MRALRQGDGYLLIETLTVKKANCGVSVPVMSTVLDQTNAVGCEDVAENKYRAIDIPTDFLPYHSGEALASRRLQLWAEAVGSDWGPTGLIRAFLADQYDFEAPSSSEAMYF